jgi:3-oxoacyl-[acyl-carrier-protein] synthase-1
VTSVGLSAPAACAAIRAGITNHTETRFKGFTGEWILGAQVLLERPWTGRAKLVKMLGRAIAECSTPLSVRERTAIPLLLCLAETDRPGRFEGLDEQIYLELECEVSMEFNAERSAIIPKGRAGIGTALLMANELLADRATPYVVIAAADSLLTAATLADFESQERLLTGENSNGFIPGEAAGAILITSGGTDVAAVHCDGVGLSEERSTINSDEPLRGDGLTRAINLAVSDAGCTTHDLDFRITDNSGEQYYFKEAALALSRTLNRPKKEFDIWHPADCVGEVGAAIGTTAIAVAWTAFRKSYAPGRRVLLHVGNDDGERAAAVMTYRGGMQ